MATTIDQSVSMRRVKVTMEAADVQSLNTSPVLIVPAGAADDYIFITDGFFFMDYNGVSYAASGGSNHNLYCTSGNSGEVLSYMHNFGSNLFNGTADVLSQSDNMIGGTFALPGQGLYLYASNDFTGAGGNVIVYVWYFVMKTLI